MKKMDAHKPKALMDTNEAFDCGLWAISYL
jgi:hypothetical protein